MDPLAAFSPDYFAARARFRQAAAARGWSLSSHDIIDGLTLDAAVSPGSGDVVVTTSGLHGVEGPFGSAVQLAWLAGEPDPPAGVRLVFLHALNPFGFARSRRFNEDGADPNRNFPSGEDDYAGSPAGYAPLDRFLNPRTPPGPLDTFYPRAAVTVLRHGMPALKQAVAGGQYDYPRGLFFGGSRPSRLVGVLAECLPGWLGDAGRVVHLDYHSGLGAWATDKLLLDVPLTPGQRLRLDRHFGRGTYVELDSGQLDYLSRGGFGPWCVAAADGRDYLFACAEFGTYTPLEITAGLRAENRAHHWGRPGSPQTAWAKRRLRQLFCPPSVVWRRRVVRRGVDLIRRAVRSVAEETGETPVPLSELSEG